MYARATPLGCRDPLREVGSLVHEHVLDGADVGGEDRHQAAGLHAIKKGRILPKTQKHGGLACCDWNGYGGSSAT